MKAFILFFALSIFCVFHASADWIITVSTETADGQAYESTFYIKGGVLKQSSPEMDVIINLNTNTIIYSNNMTQMYWQGSKEDFEKEIEEMMKMMMIEMMGEEAYEEMEKMNESEEEGEEGEEMAIPFEIEIIEEGESIELAGFSGTKFSVMVDGMLEEELWLCNDISAFRDFDYEEMDKMFGDEEDSGYTGSSQYQEMLKSNGFPIKEISYAYGEVMETVVMTSAEETSLSDDIFQAPEGYTKGGLLQVFGMGDEY